MHVHIARPPHLLRLTLPRTLPRTLPCPHRARAGLLPPAERDGVRRDGPHLSRHAERCQHAQARAPHLAEHPLLRQPGDVHERTRHGRLHQRRLRVQLRPAVRYVPRHRVAGGGEGAGLRRRR